MRFNAAEEKTAIRLDTLRQLLAEQQFHPEPRPRLMDQLTVAEVLAEKYLAEVRAMQAHLARRT